MNFFTPKLIKIGWTLIFLGFLHITSKIKLSIHGSNIKSMIVIMNELEFFG
jgi:hypothetical protein